MAANRQTIEKNGMKKLVSRGNSSQTDAAVKSKQGHPKKEKGFLIVGIGASAGGLEALESFFPHIPSPSNMAFVVVQHLAPKHKSIMDSILQKYTGMKIFQVAAGMKIEPNCIYLNPPDQDMTITNRTFHLTKPQFVHGHGLPIDCFFRSLGEDQGERAVCIILSGTGADGTGGLKAVKSYGGITMAQEEKQAKYPDMPRSAISTGLVDFVLPVEKMGEELVRYIKHSYIGGTREVVISDQQFQDSINKIFILIKSGTGHDFSHYKQNTIRRRIERRMAVHQIDKIEDYVRYLEQFPDEVTAIFKDMLITVTNFFRDPDAFEVLNKKVITKLVENRDSNGLLRVWIPGCGTGEEAYSIAMLLMEAMEKHRNSPAIQIFGTDLDAKAIEYARAGLYPESIASDVSADRLKKFFLKENGGFKVKRQIREKVVFAVQNLIKDPPFSKMDLVSCRNVLIYMDSTLQKKLFSLFYYTLNPGGYLFLGSSETIGSFTEFFSILNSKWKIYRRVPSVLETTIEQPIMPLLGGAAETRGTKVSKDLTETKIRQLAERILFETYAPPCVLINKKYEVLYFHGDTEYYISPPKGQATFDLLKMVRPEISYKLAALLRKVAEQHKPASVEGVRVRYNDNLLTVNVVVKPLEETFGTRGLLMVIFESKQKTAAPRKKISGSDKKEIDLSVAALEQELASAKEYLQTTIEELETSNEEMQSTNEELQSTNEELETSKEELQSTNEELETVNSELRGKVDELADANNDLNNLLRSTEIATIFLDTNLCIKRFTLAVSKLFNVIENDIGRPISDITTKMTYEDYCKDIKHTLDTLEYKEIDVQTKNHEWFIMRILPYRTVENVIDGVVITFFDITEAKKASQALEYADSIVATVREPLIVLDENLRVVSANRAFYNTFKLSNKGVEGQFLCDMDDGRWDIPRLKTLLTEILPKKNSIEDFQIEYNSPVIGHISMLLNSRQLKRELGKEKMILIAITDIIKRQSSPAGAENPGQKS